MDCPIIREEIDSEECSVIRAEAGREGKGGQADVPKKYKRIVGWKAICRTCKHYPAEGKKR